MLWISVDVDAHLGKGRRQVDFGTAVEVGPPALRMGDCGLVAIVDGTALHVRRVAQREVTRLVDDWNRCFGAVTPRAKRISAHLDLSGSSANARADDELEKPVDVTDDLRTL